MVDTRAVYLEPGKITLETLTLSAPGPNQVLVQTHQASVCGSERYFYRGISVRPEDEAKGETENIGAGRRDGSPTHAYPMGPLGHEGGGTILEVGAGVRDYLGGGRVAVGDRGTEAKHKVPYRSIAALVEPEVANTIAVAIHPLETFR